MKKVARKFCTFGALAITMASTAASAGADPGWSREAIEKVAQHRTTPRSAQLRGDKGVVQMAISVDGNGMITDYRMVQSSGSPILDREADLIMMRVGSFDPPPERAPQKVTIPIRW